MHAVMMNYRDETQPHATERKAEDSASSQWGSVLDFRMGDSIRRSSEVRPKKENGNSFLLLATR